MDSRLRSDLREEQKIIVVGTWNKELETVNSALNVLETRAGKKISVVVCSVSLPGSTTV